MHARTGNQSCGLKIAGECLESTWSGINVAKSDGFSTVGRAAGPRPHLPPQVNYKTPLASSHLPPPLKQHNLFNYRLEFSTVLMLSHCPYDRNQNWTRFSSTCVHRGTADELTIACRLQVQSCDMFRHTLTFLARAQILPIARNTQRLAA